MYRCDICATNLLKGNKTKPNQSKKQKYYYSKIRSNQYVMKNVKVSEFRDEYKLCSIEHSGKFIFFTISILIRLYDGEHPLNEKINVSNYITYNIESENY